MKTKILAGTAILAVLVAGAVAVAFSNSVYALTPFSQSANSVNPSLNGRAASQGEHGQDGQQGQQGLQGQQGTHEDNNDQGREQHRLNLTVGETLTFSNLTGRYAEATNRTIEGNASGAFTFTVTGVFQDGYTLSITSGIVQLGSTTYSVAPGTVVIGPTGEWATGSGSSGSGQNFLIGLAIHGIAGTNSKGRIVVDLKTATTEYLVFLRTAQSSSES